MSSGSGAAEFREQQSLLGGWAKELNADAESPAAGNYSLQAELSIGAGKTQAEYNLGS
jgi:hypothetical protein